MPPSLRKHSWNVKANSVNSWVHRQQQVSHMQSTWPNRSKLLCNFRFSVNIWLISLLIWKVIRVFCKSTTWKRKPPPFTYLCFSHINPSFPLFYSPLAPTSDSFYNWLHAKCSSGILHSCLFSWDRVSCIPSWPWICHVVRGYPWTSDPPAFT